MWCRGMKRALGHFEVILIWVYKCWWWGGGVADFSLIGHEIGIPSILCQSPLGSSRSFILKDIGRSP